MNTNSLPNWRNNEWFTLAQLSCKSNIKPDFLEKLIENKVIVADGPRENLYSKDQLVRLHLMQGLIKDIDSEASTIGLALVLLERIENLEKRLGWLQLVSLDGQNSTIH